MLEAQRLVERGEVREALQMLVSLIPPGEDYGVELASSPTISYYLDRGTGSPLVRELRRAYHNITSTARRIPWDLIPSWVFEELDFCRVMKDIARINFE
jgi:hypothetical protein